MQMCTSLRGTLAELDRLHKQPYTGGMQHSQVHMPSAEAVSTLSWKHALKHTNMRRYADGGRGQCLQRVSSV